MLTKRAPVGAVAVNTRPMCTNQGFLNFVCGKNLRPLYLAYWFKVNKPYLDAVANGSTYPELYKSDLFEFEISVPTVELQNEILKIISALQFSRISGMALEQSSSDILDLIRIRKESDELNSVIDDLLYLILSGKISIEELKGALRK